MKILARFVLGAFLLTALVVVILSARNGFRADLADKAAAWIAASPEAGAVSLEVEDFWGGGLRSYMVDALERRGVAVVLDDLDPVLGRRQRMLHLVDLYDEGARLKPRSFTPPRRVVRVVVLSEIPVGVFLEGGARVEELSLSRAITRETSISLTHACPRAVALAIGIKAVLLLGLAVAGVRRWRGWRMRRAFAAAYRQMREAAAALDALVLSLQRLCAELVERGEDLGDVPSSMRRQIILLRDGVNHVPWDAQCTGESLEMASRFKRIAREGRGLAAQTNRELKRLETKDPSVGEVFRELGPKWDTLYAWAKTSI